MTSEERDTSQYDKVYGRFKDDIYGAIRRETFGEDIGQNSWLLADEQRAFCKLLALGRASHLLEVASGSGGPALFTAATIGCQVTGVDIHEAGVAAGNEAARERGLGELVRFVHADARERLLFHDGMFDALICIDAMNHLFDRTPVLREWHRVVRSGGRILFTDPITITGQLRREEMTLRSVGIGEFVFTPPGVNERLMREAGFEDIRVEDFTGNSERIAAAWYAARHARAADLDQLEGAVHNASTQKFLETAGRLVRERRLSRFAFIARRP
jgi:SAM-dependent methyltransferase